MNIILPAALAGALALIPATAVAQSMCTVTTENLATVSLSPVYGRAVHKLRAGAVLGAGRNDIVALTDYGRLVLVRDGLALESVEPLAQNIVDFTIAHVEGARAQVVAIGSDGLVVGTYNASSGSEPTLKFSTILATSSWNSATMVDAASEGELLQIVAAHGGTLLRATFNPTSQEFVQSAPATVPSPIQFLAAADFYPDAGVEVAVGSSSMLHFYKGLANPTVAIAANPLTPLATASFIDVQRIPKGADVRDSVGVLQRHPATDVFYEVTSAIDSMTGAPAPSAPIASGGLRHAAVAYAPIGLAPGCTSNCTPTDLVFVATTSETLIFQGDPQAAGGMQFSYDAAQLSALNLAALVNAGTTNELCVAAGDLDGDGDGDLAYAAKFGSGGDDVRFVLVRNDCATVNANENLELYCLDSAGADGSWTPNQVRVGVGLRIPTPPTFPQRPNRAQVTIYVREYSTTPGAWNPDISPVVLYSAKFDVTAPTQPGETRGSLDLQTPELDLPEPWYLPPATPPAFLTDDEVLLYVRVTPILELAGGVDLNGPAINFVGSTNADLLSALCAELPADDVYQASYCTPEDRFLCPTDGAPLINEIHRRKRIRPIGTPPQ